MTYKDTIEWMFSQLPMYQRQGKTALKKDLINILAFCDVLKHPEHKFKSIHVGGTNGKGSTNTNPCLLKPAREAALRTSWNADPNAQKIQKGTII